MTKLNAKKIVFGLKTMKEAKFSINFSSSSSCVVSESHALHLFVVSIENLNLLLY